MHFSKPKPASLKRSLLLVLQGALIGTGAILPGISGGVLCTAFGVYEPIMDFLSHPLRSLRKHCRTLIPVAVGGGIGFVLLAKAVAFLLARSPVAAMALFGGLICGTVPDLAQNATKADHRRGWSGFILALVASFVLFNLLNQRAGSLTPNFGWYLFCGVIWGLSMVLPGLSSSSVLLFMGLYAPMSEGIGNFDFAVLLPLGIGFAVTLLATAKGIHWLLEHHAGMLYQILFGFMLSSLLMIYSALTKELAEQGKALTVADLPIAVGCFAAGFALAAWMGVMESKSAKAEADAAPTAEPASAADAAPTAEEG